MRVKTRKENKKILSPLLLFLTILEYFFYMLVIFRHVIQVDEYIIQIDHDIDIQKVRENVIHESMEDHRSIGKTEEHYKPFK